MEKWEGIVLTTLAASMGVICSCAHIGRVMESRAAMEHGYEQVEENGRLLWRQSESRGAHSLPMGRNQVQDH